jgi:hypothetical protein
MKSWEIVDNALDVMFASEPGLTEFDRTDLANCVSCTPAYASYLLQAHRRAQSQGLTRYVVAARDYARAAVWYVLAAPGMSPATRQRRRLTMGHADHIAVDATRRVLSDLASELDPALASHPAIQAYLVHAGASMEAQMRLLVGNVRSAVSLVEAMTGDAADRSHVKAV